MPDRRKESETEKQENIQTEKRENEGDRRRVLISDETRDKTTKFVRTSHTETLAEDLKLLDQPNWLELLYEKYVKKK